MKFVTRLLLIPAALAVGGCAANSYCLGDQPYNHSPSVPALKGAGDLRVPESASALRIPPPPAQPVPFGQTVKDKDGDDVTQCLDKPPQMVAASEIVVPPPVAAPVAAPAPVVPEPPAPPKPAPKKKKKKKAAAPATAPATAPPATKS